MVESVHPPVPLIGGPLGGRILSTQATHRCILLFCSAWTRLGSRRSKHASAYENSCHHLLQRLARVECFVVVRRTECFSFIFCGSFLGAYGGFACDNIGQPRRATRARASQS